MVSRKHISIGLFAFVILLVTFGSAQAVSYRDSSFYSEVWSGWTMNETSSPLLDINSRGRHADATTTSLTSNTGASCVYGNCWAWDGGAGDNAQNLSNVWDGSSLTSFGMCGWVYFTSIGGVSDYIIGMRQSAAVIDLTIEGGNTLYFQVRGAAANDLVTHTFTTTGAWTHLCLERSNTTLQAWVNGINVGNDTALNARQEGIANTGIVFGNHLDGSGSPLTGRMDDWHILKNRTHTGCEILELYNNSCSPPVTSNRFVITARDNTTLTSLSGNMQANVTFGSNTTGYSTTNGSIVTNIEKIPSLLVNITLGASGYATQTWLNVNTSNNFIGNLTSLPLLSFTITSPVSSVSTATHNITWTQATSPSGKTVNYNVSFYYANGTLIRTLNTTNTSLSYLWNQTQEATGNYTLRVTAVEVSTLSNQTATTTFLLVPESDYFRFYAYKYLGLELLNNILTQENYTNTSTTNNPFEHTIYDYLDLENYTKSQIVGLNITDSGFTHRPYLQNVNISRFNTTQNYSLTPNKLSLTFYREGALRSTDGLLHNERYVNGTLKFSGTSYLVVQQDLAEGYVNILLGTTSNVNWTQYYEYINDYETHVEEDIEILQQSDWSAFFEVLDLSNAPIKDAVVRVTYSKVNGANTSASFKLLGQRLTADDGFTFFIADSNTELYITVTKDGYDPVNLLLTVGDESFTRDQPFQIYLQRSTDGVLNNAWMYIQRDFSNRSLDLRGTIEAPGRDRVQIQTNYRESLGLAALDVTEDCDGFMRCPFTLRSGTDYNFTSSTDIEVSVYLDNTLWRTLTIEYDNSDKTRVFGDVTEDTDPAYLNPLLVILMILLPVIAGLIFRSSNVGTNTFLALAVLSGIISSSFLWLTAVVILYLVFRGLQKVISE